MSKFKEGDRVLVSYSLCELAGKTGTVKCISDTLGTVALVEVGADGEHWIQERFLCRDLQAADGLEEFLGAVRSSCRHHAERKGYKSDDGNKLGDVLVRMGVEESHAIGEILAKLVEFQKEPRRVLAEKVAGWAWRLWLSVDEPKVDGGSDGKDKKSAGNVS